MHIVVFDEAFWTGATARALEHMLGGAVKILLKRGIIKSEDQINITGSFHPFGKLKPAFPSIEIVPAKKEEIAKSDRDTDKATRILFQFGKIIGRMVGENLYNESKTETKQTMVDVNR